MIKLVIVIPVYQHGKELLATIQKLETYKLPVIVVNDGSDSSESKYIRQACSGQFVELLERNENGGKGKAVTNGLELAAKKGFSHAFQIDADGQHDFSRIFSFIELCSANPEALILGYPRFDGSAPNSRKAGRWITHIWVWINSMSFRVKDSMCGFRIYPVQTILDIVHRSNTGFHMEFDIEICVRSCWADLYVINSPVNVVYPEGGRSNFRLKEDNVLLTLMHTRLFLGMLIRSPVLLVKRVRGIFRGQA